HRHGRCPRHARRPAARRVRPRGPPHQTGPAMSGRKYHIDFGADDLPQGTTLALLSGDPDRSAAIATEVLADPRELSRNRGLDAYLATLPGGRRVVCATSGMGAPSLSIVVN